MPPATPPTPNNTPTRRRRLLIIGYYGLETTGDRAILASLLQHLDPQRVDVTLLSYDVNRSRRTLRLMGLDHLRVAPANGWRFLREAIASDAVVIGGGPLLESHNSVVWARWFTWARRLGAKLMVYGCGVGPLYTPRRQKAVARILNAAHKVTLRDHASLETAHRLGATRAQLAADPAVGFTATPRPARPAGSTLTIGISMRSIPSLRGLDAQSLTEIRRRYLAAFQSLMRRLTVDLEHRLVLIPTQTHEADDDRLYLNQAAADLPPDAVQPADHAETPQQLARACADLDALVATRFHAAIFGLLTAVPIVAVDYEPGGGKVSQLMRRIGMSDYLLTVESLTPASLQQAVDRLLARRAELAEQLIRARDRLRTEELENTRQLHDLLA